jgi:hypothetical protein
MSIQEIEGPKEEIAAKIAQLPGRVTRALVWVEDATPRLTDRDIDAIITELDQDTVAVGCVDDSREAIYARLEDE